MIAMKAVTLAVLRDELFSLRHPGNPEPRFTRRCFTGMIHALVCEEIITHEQYKLLNSLATNAARHQIDKTPWPAGEWLPF